MFSSNEDNLTAHDCQSPKNNYSFVEDTSTLDDNDKLTSLHFVQHSEFLYSFYELHKIWGFRLLGSDGGKTVASLFCPHQITRKYT